MKSQHSLKGKLGTFSGVLTPSLLTILGIILFRRLGYVIGSTGLLKALIIIGLANMISVLSSLSLSAIATNYKVKGGGDYYLISRSLGVEFGGAIGLVLFLAQSVSIAFYCIGFGEAVAGIVSIEFAELPRLIAAGAMLFLFIFAWLGADWATRLQYIVMVFLGIAIISFFIGGISSWDSLTFVKNWQAPSDGKNFWIIFAIFFPAVTGFTQGVSMSGDLKDPGKSLPLGTFLAVSISCVIYFFAAIVFAGATSSNALTTDFNVMKQVAHYGWMIDAGVIAATLSSALASFLGAPRILQALSTDKIFPFLNYFSKGSGSTNNPRRGVLLSLIIASITIALGNLNIIAPIVSMFFLISYGLLNYATYYEARAASPSFRPKFRWFDKRLSLLGAIGCLGAMLAINPLAGLMSVTILMAIHQYLKKTAIFAPWADNTRSYLFQRIREHLLAMESEVEHPRDWRPQILAFAKNPETREQILQFASWIEGNSGLTSAAVIKVKGGHNVYKRNDAEQEKIRNEIAKKDINAFSLVINVPDFRTGFDILLQSYGIGPLKANIVLLNWLEETGSKQKDPKKEKKYGRYIRASIRQGCNLVLLSANTENWTNLNSVSDADRRIDIWWRDDATSRLMLLLSYLMTRTISWEQASIRVIAPIRKKSEKLIERLQQTMEDIRIDADLKIVEKYDENTLIETSRNTSLVWLPVNLKGLKPVDPFGKKLEDLLVQLPVTALALAAEDIELSPEPDEGKPAEISAAVEAVRDARIKKDEAEKKVQITEMSVEEATAQLEDLKKEEPSGALKQDADLIIKDEREKQAAHIKAIKNLEQARTKVNLAVEKADELGAKLDKKEIETDPNSSEKDPSK